MQNLKMVFRYLDFTAHGDALAGIHTIGMGIVRHQKHLIVPTFSVRRNKEERIKYLREVIAALSLPTLHTDSGG